MIYLIWEHTFDNLENHTPDYFSILGYCETEETAKQKVSELKEFSKQYKGYDGQYYPKFSYEEVKKLENIQKPQEEIDYIKKNGLRNATENP